MLCLSMELQSQVRNLTVGHLPLPWRSLDPCTLASARVIEFLSASAASNQNLVILHLQCRCPVLVPHSSAKPVF